VFSSVPSGLVAAALPAISVSRLIRSFNLFRKRNAEAMLNDMVPPVISSRLCHLPAYHGIRVL